MTKLPSTARALILSFAAVAVSFTTGIAVAQVFSVRVRSAAREITENSSPSVAWVSNMRGTLRELEVRLDGLVAACRAGRCAPAPARVPALRHTLQGAWEDYRRLPTFPGEADRWPSVDALLSRLEEATSATLQAAALGDAAQADARLREDLQPLADQLDAELAALVAFDHDQGLQVAQRIDALAQESITTSVLLDVLSVGLTVLAAALAIRVVRRYERSLTERARELDEFAGRVAHDVKSPLATTATALHVARMEAMTDRGRSVLERAERGIERVRRLVDGLLEFARADAAPSREGWADLREVLDDVLNELAPAAEANGVALRIEAVPPERVACAPGILTSIVGNLVQNAITHMGAGPVRQVGVRVSRTEGGRAVRVEVEDTGPGVPESLAARVFEPFVRGAGVTRPGSGLGLATAKRLVTAHGGRIGLRSQPGSGALFWFELPRAQGSADGAGRPD